MLDEQRAARAALAEAWHESSRMAVASSVDRHMPQGPVVLPTTQNQSVGVLHRDSGRSGRVWDLGQLPTRTVVLSMFTATGALDTDYDLRYQLAWIIMRIPVKSMRGPRPFLWYGTG